MSVAKLALLAGAALVAVPVAHAQTPGPLDRLLGSPAQAPAAPEAQTQASPGPVLPTLAPPAATAPQPAPLAPPPAATAPQPVPLTPPPAAMQAPPALPPMGAARPGAGPNVQFQAPPPAAVAPERPAPPPTAELDAMSRLQTDIARLRLELEKARLEREIAQQRQPPPSATPAASAQATPVRPATALPPPPAAMPRPDPAAADRRALPQVIEIRGAAGDLVAVLQGQGGQRLTLRAGDALPNSPLKVQSIEPRQVNFVSQEGNRGPYAVPVSPPGAAAPAVGPMQGPVVRPLADTGIATPIAR